MSGLKKIVAIVVAAAVFLCLTLCVSATGLIDDLGSQEIVRIDITSDSDFVKEFPNSLSLNYSIPELPAAEPVARTEYDKVPHFAQENYPHALYGSKTVDACGSSITALAMAATYLTGYDYLPDELARCFAGKAETDAARISFAVKAMGLPVKQTDKWQEILVGLQEGKCVILQVNKGSMFAETDHFLVLTGLSEAGDVWVIDPCGANYGNTALKSGFISGFSASDISAIASYGWIFDKSQVPADLARYADAAGKSAAVKRYDTLHLTPTEKQLLARVVCVKGYGECAEGQQAMIEVILNRLLSQDFPNTLKEIVYGEDGLCDVSLLNEAEVSQVEYLTVEKAINGPYILAEDTTEFSYVCHK